MSNVVMFPSGKTYESTVRRKYQSIQQLKKDIERLGESPAMCGVLEYLLINGEKGIDLDLINKRLGVDFKITVELT